MLATNANFCSESFPGGRAAASLASDVVNSNATALFACLTYFCFASLTNINYAAMTMAVSYCGILGPAGLMYVIISD